ncbi:VIT domain-containing protein [Dysgonomonas sp. 511]|uniref:VIT domain-containing protein n=1 Tax=Dysgonomonas sp. 511 TaxID=2302930 RepID=UPI0013D890A4|nr:VIT domain-containing protein [Dysgonomonas sp. 511]NDV77767.1 DUF2135 domain-containing protein [Dysgonomonas sp. 511]
MKKYLMYLLVLICANPLFAQMPSITSTDNAVVFQKLRIDVKIVGNVASSTWTMTFENKSYTTMEGNLTFPLGEGIAVDNYAIDINGKMRNAVPVEKAKATTVFEDISRRRVDPGILEKVEGNSFRTRVYPINGRSTRTVSIGFNEELAMEGNMLKMNIPLAFKEMLKEFTINIDVIESALPPKVLNNNQLTFDKAEQTYSLSKTFKDYTPGSPINVVIPKNREIPEVIIQKENNNYYFLANVMIEGQKRVKPNPRHITILWDQSLSCENRNLEKELELLDSYITNMRPEGVRLIAFSNDIVEDKTYSTSGGNWDDLKKRLQETTYDGATNYAPLNLKKYKTDEFILFSDGLANFVGEELKTGKTVVYTIASTPKSNFTALKSIALKSKGEFINLNTLDTKQALEILSNQVFKFLGVKEVDSNGNSTVSLLAKNANEFYPSIPTIVSNNLLLAGCVGNYGQQITLQFGYNNEVTVERVIEVKGKSNDKINLARIWAAKKIEELDLDYDKNKKEIEELGRRHGIVTRNTSLMVLELVSDYIRYNIDPPAELQAEYDRLRGRTPNRNTNIEQSTFNLSYLPGRLEKWYNWKAPVIERERISNNKVKSSAPPVIVADSEVSEASFVMEDNNAVLEEVVVMGYGIQKKQVMTGSVASVSGSQLSSALEGKVAGVAVTNADKSVSKEIQTENTVQPQIMENNAPTSGFKPHVAGEKKYISIIENADDSYKAYLECRKEYNTSTKFYFDVAQFFADRNEMVLALRILSNIAELDQENYELYKGLGYKLKAMGQHHAASYAFKKVLTWRPMEPQPYRDYGLSLVDEGKHQEGLDMLIEGITRKYAANIPGLFNGVQEIFFTDINGIVARYPNLKVDERFKQYIKPVDANVRVILSWNLADSYIDLHMTDPNNERCDYRHMTTTTGGQFSTDFAGGYGPREFIQRKGVAGTYRIQTNYWGDNIQKIAGPAMIMVEVYKNFGTPQQQRTIVAVHPNTTKGNMFDVGELIWE